MCENQVSNLSRSTEIVDSNGNKLKIDFDELDDGHVLGEGTFGTVFKQKHRPTGMYFAVKRIKENTENERNALADVEIAIKAGYSDYLVTFYGALHAEGYVWILSECMEASLDKFYLKAKSLNLNMCEEFLARIAYSVLNAIKHLKNKKVMHRDIKPSNILINSKSEIKLCDFGISGNIYNSRCQTKEAGCRLYMSPEKVDPSNEHGYTVKSDIWSMGISLIEIATYEYPYETNASFFQLISIIVNQESPSLPRNKFSSEFCNFVDCCLIKDPNERADLKTLLNHRFIINNQSKQIDLAFIQQILKVI